ncbi:MAG: hypothetical protein H6667_08010 [Ardenticatenaceae bacterium]|nr:hypothetical protein [Ardenticatenaceae bacterium]MCB9444664.1 hypothetical protein [Ardenticatenaceae bacterium]
MEILRLLDQISWVENYEVEDYRHWGDGFYYRLKIQLQNQSVLFVREYVDEIERNYAFHWQDENDKMIMRWDNAPHHSNLFTFPHHKHTPEGVAENMAVTLPDVLEEIGKYLKLD